MSILGCYNFSFTDAMKNNTLKGKYNQSKSHNVGVTLQTFLLPIKVTVAELSATEK